VDGRWYASTSAFNTPIPAGAPVRPDSSSMSAALAAYRSVPWMGPTSSSVPTVGIATPLTPTVTVQLNYPSCDYKEFQIPIPAGTVIENQNESHLTVLAADGSEWDLFKTTQPGLTPLSSGVQCAASGNWAATVISHQNPGWTGSGSGQGSPRGSGIALAAGMIRPRDTQTPTGGTWDHAIAFAYALTCSSSTSHPSYVYPATSGDGTTSGSGCIPMGARLQLDPTIDCATWASIKYEWMRQECRTLQKYGAIIVDTGDAFITQYYKALGSYSYPWAPAWDVYLPTDLMNKFRVIDWTQWTG
jgi:hypothetical protein